jgi:hypothetical protein
MCKAEHLKYEKITKYEKRKILQQQISGYKTK